MHIVLASGNSGKAAEIKELLHTLDADIQVLSLRDFPDLGPLHEPGATFYDNALHKAQQVCAHSGRIALADDSGLEVDALNGQPGVFSARYSGEGATDEANNHKLLQALQGVPCPGRGARFRCVLVASAPNGELLSVHGTWEGSIATRPEGSEGFGYDPVFVDQETGKTAARMSRGEKSARSHRGQALRQLLQFWPEFVQRAAKTKTS